MHSTGCFADLENISARRRRAGTGCRHGNWKHGPHRASCSAIPEAKL